MRVLMGLLLIAGFFEIEYSRGQGTDHNSIGGPKAWDVWNGSQSTNWTDPLNWSAGVPDASTNVKISDAASNFPVITSPAYCRDLEITSSALLTLANAALIISGNITNNGTLNASTGTLTFFGSENTIVSGNSLQVNRVVLNKASLTDTILLNTDIAVSNEMLFIKGLVYAESQEVVFLDESDSRDGSKDSFVDGQVRKVGNNDFTFPIGDSGHYAPLKIFTIGNDTEEFTAEYFHQNPDSLGYNTTAFEGTLTNVSSCEFWDLHHDIGSGSARVMLSYETTRSCGVDQPLDLRVVHWNGAQWEDLGSSGYEGDVYEGTIKAFSSISSFSPFTLGSTSSLNPLPIELLSFDVMQQNSSIKIEWSTATETNSDYFKVERSLNANDYLTVAIIDGAGNSTNIRHYETLDEIPSAGIAYYRLKQYDFDGGETIYPPRAIQIDIELVIEVFPNPADDHVQIMHRGLGDVVRLKLFNSVGQMVKSAVYSSEQIYLSTLNLPAGHYIIELSGSVFTQREQLIIR